jgi:hypothetical protein
MYLAFTLFFLMGQYLCSECVCDQTYTQNNASELLSAAKKDQHKQGDALEFYTATLVDCDWDLLS